MFTGLIEDVGTIKRVIKKGNSVLLTILPNKIDNLKLGDSVAINGVCLTVINLNGKEFVVEATHESLNRTNILNKKIGNLVNLERAMPANGRFDGHVVQGHVDTVGYISKIRDIGLQKIFEVKFDSKYDNLVVEKGSIALDGVSLTISNEKSGAVEVSIITHTLENCTIGNWKVGDKINIEFDIIGKYLLKQNRR